MSLWELTSRLILDHPRQKRSPKIDIEILDEFPVAENLLFAAFLQNDLVCLSNQTVILDR